jgi:acetyl-CoA carboxylase biotin carboxylase subunit
MTPIRSVLVANRGEISVRILRTCRRLGLRTVLAVSEADRDSLGTELADRVVCIGPPASARSYLDVAAVIAAAVGTDVDAVHPGYGFLSEDPRLAAACQEADLVFLGPTSETIAAVGNKLAARELAERTGVPMLPGSGRLSDLDQAQARALEIGLPVLVKAAAGGGGRGMRIVERSADLATAITGAAAEAQAAFGDPTLYIERYVADALHVEVQVIGDRHGGAASLGDRDCSVQRRHQKVVEEAPAWRLDAGQRAKMSADAVRLVTAAGYSGLGTVEFVYDRGRGDYHFLEINARIQVEHPVTEQVTGLDLVELQLAVGDGAALADILPVGAAGPAGHSIELRINAEDPAHGFRPSPGRLTVWEPPGGPGIRLDSHCRPGYVVPPYYDSMVGKLIVTDRDRPRALARARAALGEFTVEGIRTTIPLLRAVLDHPDFASGAFNTTWLEKTMPALIGDGDGVGEDGR